MKISLVGPIYPYRGGIAHYTAMLYEELEKNGHDVSLYSFKRMYPKWPFPGRSDQCHQSHPCFVPRNSTIDSMNPMTWLKTAKMIRASGPDLLILHWWIPFFSPLWLLMATICRKAGIGVVFICHNVLPHERFPGDVMLAKMTLRCGDALIVASTQQRDELLPLVSTSNIYVVPHPVNYLLTEHSFPQKQARRILKLSNSEHVLLFFGFVRKYKGLNFLLKALPSIREKIPRVRLCIVGEFWEDKREYEAQIRSLDVESTVRIVDRYVSDEEAGLYFSAADVIVLPYTKVTQSAVLQLSFAFGKPVIASRVGALAEAVCEGETGLLVNPADHSALAQAVVDFFEKDMALHMRQKIQQTKENFSWSRLVETLEFLAGKFGRSAGADFKVENYLGK